MKEAPMAVDSQVSAADVRIQSLTASAQALSNERAEVTSTITIYSDNDDDASNVRCIVVLPPTSRVISSNPPAVTGPSFPALGPPDQFIQSEPTNGYAIFELASPLQVGQSAALELVTSVHRSWAEHGVSAFVFSSVPDPDPSNNCAHIEVTLPAEYEATATA
jgi:hypothetical protein